MENGEIFYVKRDLHVTYLLRNNSASDVTGIFQCVIPNGANSFQNIYVGVYQNGIGKNNTLICFGYTGFCRIFATVR